MISNKAVKRIPAPIIVVMIVEVKDALIFSNFISLKGQLLKLGTGKNMLLDLTATKLVDHTVMQRLLEFSKEYAKVDGGRCIIVGRGSHEASSRHQSAARRQTGPLKILTFNKKSI